MWVTLGLNIAGFSPLGLVLLYGGSFGFLWTALFPIFPILRSKVSPEVASTAIGAVNLLSILGGALFQQIFGALINRFEPVHGAYPVAAYQLAFGVGMATACAGLLITAVGVLLRPAKSQERGA
jgi:hypothetical protein